MTGDIRTPFWTRHRGPYTLVLTRPHKLAPRARAGFATTEWLKGSIGSGEDVVGEAWALLRDPRDSIEIVNVWSVTEQCFVGAYRRKDDPDGDS